MYTIATYSVYTGTLCEPVGMYICVKEKQTKEVGIYNRRVDARKGAHIWGNPTNMINNAWQGQSKFERKTTHSGLIT